MEFEISEILFTSKVFGEDFYFTRPKFFFHIDENLYWRFVNLPLRVMTIIKFEKIFEMAMFALANYIDAAGHIPNKIIDLIDSKIYDEFNAQKIFQEITFRKCYGVTWHYPKPWIVKKFHERYGCKLHLNNTFETWGTSSIVAEYIDESEETLKYFIYTVLRDDCDMKIISEIFAEHHPTVNIPQTIQKVLDDENFNSREYFPWVKKNAEKYFQNIN